MSTFYALVRMAGVYVKDGDYFEVGKAEAQDARSPEWWRDWESIEAPHLDEARQIAIALRRYRYPGANRTIGEPAINPREPRTDIERAEASAAEIRGDGLPMTLQELVEKQGPGR